MDFKQYKLNPNPRRKANPISKLFFLWIVPFFQKGYKLDLTFEDLYSVQEDDDAELLGNNLEKAWQIQIKKAEEAGRKPKLLNALTSLFGRRFAFFTIFYAFDAWFLQVFQPIFLRLLIQSLDDEDSWNSYFYAGGVCLATTVRVIVVHPSAFEMFHIGMQCRVACSALIYRKSLKLSKASQGEATVGKLVNLLSNDVNRFDQNLNVLLFLFIGPGQLIIFAYFLWDAIGPSSLAGIGFVVLFIPAQYMVGKYSGKYRLSLAKRTDERGRIMNEILVGIRVIKMYAWEKPFSLLIDGIRKLEVKELKKRAILRGIQLALSNYAMNKFIVYVTLLVYVLSGNVVKSETVFFALTSLNILVVVMIQYMPQAASGLGETIVAINRIEEFLLLEEQQVGDIRHSPAGESSPPGINLSLVTASWTKDRTTLKNISVDMQGNRLLMIVGSVGSGKTSFLHTLIAELPISSGEISITGTTAYASQEAWIFSGNLRQNILFGQPFDSKRYAETIKACCLEEDLQQLPHGDMTVVGERGVALSGGQKARVNLARALYREADIYLMDDPLSAVDARVSRQLFEGCIQGYLSKSLRILVTHQLQYLPQADHIVVLHQGKVLAQGTYEEIVSQRIDFVSLMVSSEGEEELIRRNSVIKPTVEGNKHKSGSDKKPAGKVEKMVVGSVTAKTYWEYFNTAKSPIQFVGMVLSFLVSQLVLSGNDYWLSVWTNAEDKQNSLKSVECLGVNGTTSICEDDYLGRNAYLYVFTGLNISAVILSVVRALFFYIFCTKISINLHDWMFKSLVRAPTKFFDENPSGNILNRFTKDVGAIDELLPPAFAETITMFLNMLGVITLVIMSNYYLSVPTVFLFLPLFFIRKFFVQTARDLKRIESMTRSPLFTHVAATVQGITTIRASKTETILMEQFDGHQNMHSSAWYLFIAGNRWLGVWLELISCVFLTFVAFSFLILASSNDGGNVGLAISSVLTLMGSFQRGMRQSAETENFMTSVERALEYAKLKPEAPLESSSDKKPPTDWPRGGEIRFQQVSLAYGEAPVLKQLTFDIGPRQKIGIVGRTGAGKSSIVAALFRMTEPTGDIFIDGIRINDIGLHDLRKKVSIIPQDPVLFSGTVRYNLDPFGQFEDNELWTVIDEVELKDAVPTLEFKVADGGGNFSIGQRQLICLARAILKKNRILLMDEATANIDPKTDSLIQKTIRNKFGECTIITIAHRLQSVIDCDRILVLDNGYLKEFDHPHVLLKNSHGMLSSMVAQTGRNSDIMLRKIAQETFNGRRLSFQSENYVPIPNGDGEELDRS